jgi:hypothetical protein
MGGPGTRVARAKQSLSGLDLYRGGDEIPPADHGCQFGAIWAKSAYLDSAVWPLGCIFELLSS